MNVEDVKLISTEVGFAISMIFVKIEMLAKSLPDENRELYQNLLDEARIKLLELHKDSGEGTLKLIQRYLSSFGDEQKG